MARKKSRDLGLLVAGVAGAIGLNEYKKLEMAKAQSDHKAQFWEGVTKEQERRISQMQAEITRMREVAAAREKVQEEKIAQLQKQIVAKEKV